MHRPTNPMTLICPRCGAEPGQVCTIFEGQMVVVHVERIEAAAAQGALDTLADESTNHLRFRLGPGEISLSLSARVKRPGEELVSKPAHLSIVEEPNADEVDAYERLWGDAIRGDGMLFVREDAVEAAWAIVDPILSNEIALHQYEPCSWGPGEADRLALDVGGWHNPEGDKESTA